jgi:hypothetical protein
MRKPFPWILAGLAGLLLFSLPQPARAGCPIPENGKEIPFGKIAGGSQGTVVTRQLVLVRDMHSWKGLWERIHANRFPLPPRPEVDFSREWTAAVFMGEKPSGGYSITVDSIREYPDRIVIFLRNTAPPPGAIVTMALTQPWEIARLSRTRKPVFFKTLPPD